MSIVLPLHYLSVRAVDQDLLSNHPNVDKKKGIIQLDSEQELTINFSGEVVPPIRPQRIELKVELSPRLTYYYVLKVFDSKILNINLEKIEET